MTDMTALASPDADIGLPAALSVLTPPPGLATRYARLTLVSHRRHVEAMVPDADTLVVSTDWLTWRLCLVRGIACVHFEFALADWPDARGPANTAHLRHGEWVCDADGRDFTRFAGVSLGKLFVRGVTMFANAYDRMWHALDRLCERFAPHELVLLDLRAEFDLLDDAVKRRLAAEIAARHGAILVDRLDPPSIEDAGFAENAAGFGSPDHEPRWRSLLRAAYGTLVAGLFALRRILDHREPVLMIHNWATTAPLLEYHDSTKVVPSLFAASLPKRPRFLWSLWCRGVVLVRLPSVSLNAAEGRAVAAIGATIGARAATETGTTGALFGFLRDRVVATGWLRQQAIAAKAHDQLFRRHRFARLVVGDSTNDICRVAIEAARGHGVAVDELPNGMFITPQHYDTRTGDRAGPPLIDRMLCWGPSGERWITAQAPGMARVRTGYPALDPLRRPPRPLARLQRALVLPVYADCDDVSAFTSNIFGWLAGVVETLAGLGCGEIRVKLHNGPQNPDYYREVLRQAGLQADIVKGGPLQPHLAWADVAIGPSNSGAMVEALAAGLPYYAVVPIPSLIDVALLPTTIIVQSTADLAARLQRRDGPDIATALDDLCDFAAIPNASRQVWRALEKG